MAFHKTQYPKVMRISSQLSRAMRKQLKALANYTCSRCGRKEPEIKLTIDHVTPKSKGGTNRIGNMQVLCEECNKAKGTEIVDYRVVIDPKPIPISNKNRSMKDRK